MRVMSVILCSLLLGTVLSGCIWGTVAVVGVAVVGANVEEIREAGIPVNATRDLDEHLDDARKVDEALKNASTQQNVTISTEEIIDEYAGALPDN